MTRGRRGGIILLALAAVVAGVVLLVVAVRAQVSAPKPPHSVGRIEPKGPTGTTQSTRPTPLSPPAPLAASRPLSIQIPAIGVNSHVFPIGLGPGGGLAVPQPGPRLNSAAWFKNSPTPGQPGPSIIEGHVDSVQGASVFFKLGALRPGNRIWVERADGVKLRFTVDAVRDYLKKSFPTRLVYGGDNTGRPELRLITCSDFNTAIHHHVGNEVVFTHLTKVVHPHA